MFKGYIVEDFDDSYACLSYLLNNKSDLIQAST